MSNAWVVDGWKRCAPAGCGQVKPVSEFNRLAKAGDGLQAYCRECQKVLTARSRAKNPPKTRSQMSREQAEQLRAENRRYYAANKKRWRTYVLPKRYGVTADWYSEQLVRQGGRCAFPRCKNPPPPPGEPLDIDHHRESGQVRELLCNWHNRGIGMFHEDVDELKDAIEYLQRHAMRGAVGVQKRTPARSKIRVVAP